MTNCARLCEVAKSGVGAGWGWVAAEAVAAEAAAAEAMAAREGSTAAVATAAEAATAAALAEAKAAREGSTAEAKAVARGRRRSLRGEPACTWRGKRRCSHFQTREIGCRRGMRGVSAKPGMDLKCVCVVRTAQRGCTHAELQKHAVGG